MVKHIIVVGSGIVGSALAYRLSEAGARVTVLDRTSGSEGASARSFGWINANDAEPAFYNHFRQSAIAAWKALPQTVELPVHWHGSLACENGENAVLDHAQALAALGVDARVVGREEIAKLAPKIRDLRDLGVYCADEGAVDAPTAARWFMHRAQEHSADRIAGVDVQALKTHGDRITGVDTSFGPFEADCVVLAAGTGTAELAATVGVDIPMDNKKGLIVQTHPVSPIVEPIILTETVHFRQEPDGRIVAGEVFSGGGVHADLIETNPAFLGQKIIEELQARLPDQMDIRLQTINLGIRPTPRDGRPIIDMPKQGLFVVTMHSGVTLAPHVAALSVPEILGETATEALADYRLGRFTS